MSYFNSITRINAPNPLAEFLDAPDPIYGTGVDGDVVLDGSLPALGMTPVAVDTYLMTRDLYFNNLTINTGVSLRPNGFRVFVKNTLTMHNDSRIGFTSGFDVAGSIAQGSNNIVPQVENSLGGSSLTIPAIPPIEALGGADYYRVPHQAIRGWAVSASNPTPQFLRGGAGHDGPGGGVVIMAARYINIASGQATISAPGLYGSGGGVVILVSSHATTPANLILDVSGQNDGTSIYMQLV